MDFDIFFQEDYRGNSNLRIEPALSEDHEGDPPYDIIKLKPSKRKKYTLYLYVTCDRLIRLTKGDDLDKMKHICLEVHSYVNKHGPFECTGYEGFYKQTGSYGEPTPITHKKIMKKIKNHKYIERLACCIVIDQDNNISHILSINPPS